MSEYDDIDRSGIPPEEDLSPTKAGLYLLCREKLFPEDVETVLLTKKCRKVLGYVAGRLAAEGYDPDEVFAQYGIVEKADKTE